MTNVQVDLRSIVDLLSHHLYSSPSVVVRELLQNGVDALHARRLVEEAHVGSVRVEVVGEDAPTLVVEDDGVGLTREDIATFLSTIGRSSKRDELDFSRGDFLGQFGIGLLSCFLVADEITVVTRSHASKDAWVWKGRADGTYSVEPAPERSVGTSVYVPLRPDMHKMFSPKSVHAMVESYGRLLPQQIIVQDNSVSHRVGGRPLPWSPQLGWSNEDLLSWGEDILGEKFSHAVFLSDPGSESTGVAFVAARSVSPGVKQRHLVTLKGMLLSDSVEGVLPPWAFFARVVLDTRELRPTASRESLVRNDILESASETFGRNIISWLESLASSRPEELQEFVATHHLALKSLAVHDEDLLRIIHPWLPVETSLGTMTFRELLERPGAVRVSKDRDSYRQLLQVCTAQGICLVNGGYTYDNELLVRLSETYPEIEIETLTPEDMLSALEMVPPAERAAAAQLERIASETLSRFHCEVIVRSFRPANAPVLHAASENERFRRATSSMKASVDGFWGDTLDQVMNLAPSASTSLCLNYANSLIVELAEVPDSPRLRAAIELLYVQALLLGHQTLDSAEARLVTSSVATLAKGN